MIVYFEHSENLPTQSMELFTKFDKTVRYKVNSQKLIVVLYTSNEQLEIKILNAALLTMGPKELWGFPGVSDGKKSTCNAEIWVYPWVRKIFWRREWLLTLVFLPGEPHGQRSLAGYSPWGRKESDTTTTETPIGIPSNN